MGENRGAEEEGEGRACIEDDGGGDSESAIDSSDCVDGFRYRFHLILLGNIVVFVFLLIKKVKTLIYFI